MNEEILTNEENQEESAVDIIAEMKANTVSKEKYNRLEMEHNKLLKALANGEDVDIEPEEKPDINQLRRELFLEDTQKMSDLEFVTKTLQLRDAIIDEGGIDPFVPTGRKTAPEDSDFATAEKVATVLKECIAAADGDNDVFLAEVQRRTMDVSPISRKPRR